MNRLQGKTAIITVASTGIGATIAKAVVYAITQPDSVIVNEITIRPV